jgi:hypothetical protein
MLPLPDLDVVLYNDWPITGSIITPRFRSSVQRDFTADGMVDEANFLLWNQNKFMSSGAFLLCRSQVRSSSYSPQYWV